MTKQVIVETRLPNAFIVSGLLQRFGHGALEATHPQSEIKLRRTTHEHVDMVGQDHVPANANSILARTYFSIPFECVMNKRVS